MKLNPIFLLGALLTTPIAARASQSEFTPDTKYFAPVGDAKNVALLLLGGSEGGYPDYYDTKSLTQKGYACLIVGYFNTEHTTDRLELIPLEYFEAAIDSFRAKPEVSDKKLVVWGGSKGGELALLLASRFDDIEGVIAAVPSSVVFQGLGGRAVSSWSYGNEKIPFVPFAPYDWSTIVNAEYVEAYRLSLEQKEAVEKAAIKVENINGPILILSGESDTMWPSSQMGEMIDRRLKSKAFPHWFHHYAYENAGHTLNEGYMMGGTEAGNRAARIDSGKRVDEFLQRLDRGNKGSVLKS